MHARATQYLNQLRASPDAWRFCLERFFATSFIEVKVRRTSTSSTDRLSHSSIAYRPCKRSSPRGAAPRPLIPRAHRYLYLRRYDALSPEVQAQLRTALFSWLGTYLVANPNESLRMFPDVFGSCCSS